MAKNITLMGADYPDVPAVQLPQTGGGTATFYDIDVIDNLTSTSTTDALSANQGKVLKTSLDALIPQKLIADSSRMTRTLILPNSGRFCVDFVTAYIDECFSIILVTTTAGAVRIQEKSKGADVTLDGSVDGKLTVTIAHTQPGYFLITGNSIGKVNDITII